jgi:alanyl-tRNA synthetase
MTGSEFDLAFFNDNGFKRRCCPKCQRYFWSLGDWETCGEPPCEEYTFIGNSPMKERLTLHEMREAYLSFFENNGHGRVKRYPIVARWRDDVFFTQASIYDFQPWVLNGVIEPPYNPLTISQTCVRFNDIDNVGKTGRHFTFFEMCAHHAFNKKDGQFIYFKDRTVELCHRLFTESLGTDPLKMRYVEEWWEGGGNAGPCVEVILDGVEVATLVFMMYRDTPDGRKPMDMTVVDTGYGLERMTWVSQGVSSAYEAVFGPVVTWLKDLAKVSPDERVLTEYSKVAGSTNMRTAADVRRIRETTAERMGISYDELMGTIAPLEDIYVICDHSRALMLMLNDGVVPSNVRDGYFARMLVRRALRSIRSLDLDLRLAEVVGRQIDYFQDIFPELVENREDILKLVQVEEDRYFETLGRGRQLVGRLVNGLGKGEKLPLEKLVELYDSHGLNPEIAKEFAPERIDVPDNFYMQVAARHERPEEEVSEVKERPESMPETRLLYYEDPELTEFEATVLEEIDGGVVLDQTAFYPEGGGQEWDLGILDGKRVCRVIKIKTTVVHFLEGGNPPIGSKVRGSIDLERRQQLMRHHTAAHLINGVARGLFGNHIWQAGAHKAVDQARLDVTHFENLSTEQRDRLEREVNGVVLKDLPISIQFMPRDEAEAKHGYRLYQGGAVPGKIIRVVDVKGLDAEACGGLHCSHTGMVGTVRIARTKRIQDGVVRIEYAAGMAAVAGMQSDKRLVEGLGDELNVPAEKLPEMVTKLGQELREQRKRLEQLSAVINEMRVRELLEAADQVGEVRVVVHEALPGEDPEDMSKQLSSQPRTVAVIGVRGEKAKLLVARSADLRMDCRKVLKAIMALMGGGGGGKPDHAQGGGGDPQLLEAALKRSLEIVSRELSE